MKLEDAFCHELNWSRPGGHKSNLGSLDLCSDGALTVFTESLQHAASKGGWINFPGPSWNSTQSHKWAVSFSGHSSFLGFAWVTKWSLQLRVYKDLQLLHIGYMVSFGCYPVFTFFTQGVFKWGHIILELFFQVLSSKDWTIRNDPNPPNNLSDILLTEPQETGFWIRITVNVCKWQIVIIQAVNHSCFHRIFHSSRESAGVTNYLTGEI